MTGGRGAWYKRAVDRTTPSGYELLDSGDGRKLERFASVVTDRPCAQALWRRRLDEGAWARADATFVRRGGRDTEWQRRRAIPESWPCEVDGLSFELSSTDFGHVGVFPEHVQAWRAMSRILASRAGASGERPRVLNLFAYTGGATLAAVRAGAAVCHLDASPKSVAWARRNAALNGMGDSPVRWITDDALKFLSREERRGSRYEGVILDPPSFGRGARGEVFKLEEHAPDLLDRCRAVLAEAPLFMLVSCHTPGLTPLVLSHLLQAAVGLRGRLSAGESTLEGGEGVWSVPCGAWALWEAR